MSQQNNLNCRKQPLFKELNISKYNFNSTIDNHSPDGPTFRRLACNSKTAK